MLVFFDGFFGYNKSQKNVITKHKNFADQVQQLALHAGWTAKLEKDEIKNLYKVSICTKKKYSIVNHFLKKLRKPQIEKLEKDKKCPVFCLQVPSEVFYIRRNGKTCCTANIRAQGHVTTLTRQPLEGRSRDGGLRFGENFYLPQWYVIILLVRV